MNKLWKLLGCIGMSTAITWSVYGQEPAPRSDGGLVQVALRPTATLGQGVVRLGDVAEIQGGSDLQRSKVQRLDVAELDDIRSETVLTREQLYFRLRLAGFEPSQFRLAGATASVVQRGAKAEVPAIPRKAAANTAVGDDVPPLIKARDSVRLVVRIGSVEISARGEAMEEGRAGQMVRVRNFDSGKVVSGRLNESRIVEVEY